MVRLAAVVAAAARLQPGCNAGVALPGALEVNRGALRRWGVRDGSVVTLRRPSRA